MELKLINDQGAAGTLKANDEIFGRDFNEPLVHQVSIATRPRRTAKPSGSIAISTDPGGTSSCAGVGRPVGAGSSARGRHQGG